MMKYIDAEKLIAEIDRLHKAHSGKHGCDEVGLNLEYLEDFIDSFQQEPLANMVQWAGNNLKEVIDFTGKSPRFGEWFKSWEEYENYVHSHNDILKLFCEDGSHYEVPVGAWIVKTPDGYNVPSVAKYVQQKRPEVERGWGSGPDYNTEEGRYSNLFKHRQEQPEVDLEKEIMRYQREDMDRDTTVRDVAQHFAEWGAIHLQPEVDLGKDIDDFFDKWDRNSNGCFFDENGAVVTIKTIKDVVKHFLNARKER